MKAEVGTFLKIKAQIICAGEIAFGPGKAGLLHAIADEGSISAAARALGLSYRRAWLMVDTMNRCWQFPLVETSKGGRSGAKLTDFGKKILSDYQQLSEEIETLTTSELAQFFLNSLNNNTLSRVAHDHNSDAGISATT